MALGDIPNKLPNSYLGIWIQVTDEHWAARSRFYLGRKPFPGYVATKVIATAIPPSELTQPGEKEIVIKQVSTEKTFPVGTFVIKSK